MGDDAHEQMRMQQALLGALFDGADRLAAVAAECELSQLDLALWLNQPSTRAAIAALRAVTQLQFDLASDRLRLRAIEKLGTLLASNDPVDLETIRKAATTLLWSARSPHRGLMPLPGAGPFAFGGEEAEHLMERGDARQSDAGGGGGAERGGVQGVELQRPAGVEVELHARQVGGHLQRVVEHFVDEDVGDGLAAGGGAGLDLDHQGAAQIASGGVGHDAVGGGVEHDRQAVVGDVPDELVPARGQEIGHGLHVDAGGGEVGGDGGEARRYAGWAAGGDELAEPDLAVIEVGDMARPDLVTADERQSAQDAIGSDQVGGGLLDAQAVLKHEHRPAGSKRRQELGQQVVVGGFEADDRHVAWGHVLRTGVNEEALGREGEAAADRIDAQAVGLDVVEIAAEKEVDAVAVAGEQPAVVAADGPCADDGIMTGGHTLASVAEAHAPGSMLMSIARGTWVLAGVLMLAGQSALGQANVAEQQRIDRLWAQHWREFAAFYVEHEGRFVCFASYNRALASSRGVAARDYAKQSAREFTTRDDRGRETQKTFTKPQGDIDVHTKALPELAPGQYGYIHSGMVDAIDGPDTLRLRDVWLVDAEKVRQDRETATEEFRRQWGRDVDEGFRDRRGPRLMERFEQYREQLEWQFEERTRAERRQRRWSDMTWRVVGFDTKSLVTGRRWPAGGGSGGEGIQVAILAADGGSVVAAPASRLGKGVTEEQFKKVLEQRGLTVDRFAEILTEQKRTNPMRYRDAVLAAIEGKSLDAPTPGQNTEVREFEGD